MSAKSHLERLRSLRRQLGSLLNESTVRGQLGSTATPGAWLPVTDVFETAREFQVSAELPGVLRDDIDLRVGGPNLEITGVRRPPEDSGNFYRMEGRYGPFRRVVTLSDEADEEKIEAALDRGVLSIRIAKRKPGLERLEIAVDWRGDDG